MKIFTRNKIGKCEQCGDYWVELPDGTHCETCKKKHLVRCENAARMTTASEVVDEA